MSDKKIPKNPYIATFIIFLVLTVLFLFLIFLPFISDINKMQWGYALSFISIILTITFAITSAVYAGMAKRLGKIFSGTNVLTHWEYSKEEWLKYSAKEFKKQKSEKWGIFILIAIITVIVGVIFNIIYRDAWKVVAISLSGLLLLLAFIAFIIPRVKYNRERKNTAPEVYIGLNGIYLAGEFHLWNFLSSKLEEVNFNEKEMLIIIKYSYYTRVGVSYTDVRIPVPQSKREEAEIIVERLNKETRN